MSNAASSVEGVNISLNRYFHNCMLGLVWFWLPSGSISQLSAAPQEADAARQTQQCASHCCSQYNSWHSRSALCHLMPAEQIRVTSPNPAVMPDSPPQSLAWGVVMVKSQFDLPFQTLISVCFGKRADWRDKSEKIRYTCSAWIWLLHLYGFPLLCMN